MAFTKQNAFTKKTTDLPDIPSTSGFTPTDIKTYIQTPADELKNTVNKLVDDLNTNETKWVTREKLADGVVGTQQLDPSITSQPKTEFEVQAKFDSLDSQLAQITYNVKSFGATGDGVTDDTQAIKDAIAYIKTIGRGNLLFPFATYKVSDVFMIDYELSIDFDGSTILYENNTKDYTTADNNAIFWYQSEKNEGTFVPVTSALTRGANTFTLSDATGINVGDYVCLQFKGGTELASFHFYTCQVIAKSGNDLTLDFEIGYDFDVYGYTAEIKKYNNVLKNISVKNGIVEDISTAIETTKIVNGFTFDGAIVNITVDNIKTNKTGAHGIKFAHTNNVTVKNVEFNNTRSQSAGYGYGLRCIMMVNTTVENIQGNNIRHVIDHTGSYLFRLKHGIANSVSSACWCTHGQYEYDLQYEDVKDLKSTYSIGVGDSDKTVSPYFMRRTRKLTIKNSELNSRMMARGASNLIFDTVNIKKSVADNHLLGLDEDTKFINCKVKGNIQINVCTNGVGSDTPNPSHNRKIGIFDIINSELDYVYMPSAYYKLNEGTCNINNSVINQPGGTTGGMGCLNFNMKQTTIIGAIDTDSIMHIFSKNISLDDVKVLNSCSIQPKDNGLNITLDKIKWKQNKATYANYLLLVNNCKMDNLKILDCETDILSGQKGLYVYLEGTGIQTTVKNLTVRGNFFPQGTNLFLFPKGTRGTTTNSFTTDNIFEDISDHYPTTPPANQIFRDNIYIASAV